MAAMTILVFSLSALFGCCLFYIGWSRSSRHPSALRPFPWFLQITAGGSALLLIIFLIVYISEVYSEVGHLIWHAFRVATSPVGYCLPLGFIFGYIFGYWTSFLLEPESLSKEATRRIHGRWGIVLMGIAIVALFAPSFDRLFDRVTQIGSPALSVTLISKDVGESARAEIVQVGREPDEEIHMSPLTKSSYYSREVIPYLEEKIARDPYYIYIFSDKNIEYKYGEILERLKSRADITRCLSRMVRLTQDPLMVHKSYGDAFHKFRRKLYGDEPDPERGLIDEATIQDLFDSLFRTSRQETAGEPGSGDNSNAFWRHYCAWRLSDPEAVWPESGITPHQDPAGSLYETLLVSFALGSAGAHETSIRTLASWINRVENTAPPKQNDSHATLTRRWALVRAKQYLIVALDIEGFEAAKYSLLSDMLSDMEELFRETSYARFGTFLVEPDEWAYDDTCRALIQLDDKIPMAPRADSQAVTDAVGPPEPLDYWPRLDFLGEKERQRLTFTPSRAAAMLALSYVTFTNVLVQSSFAKGIVTADILNHARRNARLPNCFYKIALTDSANGLPFKVTYHEVYARTLLFAAETWGGKLAYTDLSVGEVYEEALRHMISAKLALDAQQKTSTGGTQPEWYRAILTGQDGTRLQRDRISLLIEKLTARINEM